MERPPVRLDLERVKQTMEQTGTSDGYIEDNPKLKDLVLKKDKRFLIRGPKGQAKYIFALKKDPKTGKHKFVSVTGLLPEHIPHDVVDITQRFFPDAPRY